MPFWVLDGFAEISAKALEGMAGTTGLEPAGSAVTAPSFGNRLKLCGTDGYQSRALEPHVTIIGPSMDHEMDSALQLISCDQGRRLVQFWSLSPRTRLNSRSLLVTRVSPADLA